MNVSDKNAAKHSTGPQLLFIGAMMQHTAALLLYMAANIKFMNNGTTDTSRTLVADLVWCIGEMTMMSVLFLTAKVSQPCSVLGGSEQGHLSCPDHGPSAFLFC